MLQIFLMRKEKKIRAGGGEGENVEFVVCRRDSSCDQAERCRILRWLAGKRMEKGLKNGSWGEILLKSDFFLLNFVAMPKNSFLKICRIIKS